MGGTNILTQCGPFRKARSTSVVSASYPSMVPTSSEPSTSDTTVTANTTHQAIPIGTGGGGLGQNTAILIPYGLGSDNDAFSMRVYGWRQVGSLWLPVLLAEWSGCTLAANLPGVATTPVIATEFFCDSITRVTGTEGVSVETIVPGADLIAHATVAIKGFQKLELVFDTTTGTPTCNCLVGMF
jgi:hypothetical protein